MGQGKHARSVFVGWWSIVDKKSVFEFFGAGRGGSLVGGRKGRGWGWGSTGRVGPGRLRRGCKGWTSGLGGGLQAQEEWGVGAGGWGWAEGPPARNGFGCWTSGLGGVGGRGRASTHGAFLWASGHKSSVLSPTKKVFLSLLGPGSLVGGRKVVGWGGGPLVRGGRGGGWGLGGGLRAREE